jgi:hypothetical protein
MSFQHGTMLLIATAFCSLVMGFGRCIWYEFSLLFAYGLSTIVTIEDFFGFVLASLLEVLVFGLWFECINMGLFYKV